MTNSSHAKNDATESARDKWLDRVRKLLAKAEDPAVTPEEAEALTAKATELIARYGIDEALLAAQDPINHRPADRIIFIEGAFALDKQRLLSSVAMSLGCKTVLSWRQHNGRRRYQVQLYGFQTDIERAEILYTSLLVQMVNALAQTEVPYWDNAAAFKRSWIDGYRNAVCRRIRESEDRAKRQAEQTQSGGPSVALVLADRASLVEAALYAAHPGIKPAKSRKLSGWGKEQGYAAGQRANLGGTQIGGRASAAISR